jgi:parallel beta-helix repeat protein
MLKPICSLILLLLLIIPLGNGIINENVLVKKQKGQEVCYVNRCEDPLQKEEEKQDVHLLVDVREEYNPIYINGNEDFNVIAQSEEWVGNGSFSNPYIINGLNFTSDYNDILVIYNTNVHFKIMNCFLITDWSDPYLSPWNYAIRFENVSNAIISNNTILYSVRGLRLFDCTNITFFHNEIRNHGDGINLVTSTNVQIIDNTLTKIITGAIDFYSSGDCLISGNIISKIYSHNSHDGSGIYFQSSWNNTISTNTINTSEGAGIRLHNSNTITICNNDVSKNNRSGIFLKSTTSSLILNNEISSNNQSGIVCQSSWETPISQNTISSNTITNNGEDGIHLLYSMNDTLNNNIVTENCKEGISFVSSEGNTLTNNTIANNSWYGIAFSSSSHYNRVQSNNFTGNNPDGKSQAIDNGTHNTFEYNFWDDWSIPDTNADGLVDVPYLIDGETNNFDWYPIARLPPSPTTSLSLTHSSSTHHDNSLDIQPILQILGVGVIILFVTTLVIIIRLKQMG